MSSIFSSMSSRLLLTVVVSISMLFRVSTAEADVAETDGGVPNADMLELPVHPPYLEAGEVTETDALAEAAEEEESAATEPPMKDSNLDDISS